VIDAAMLISRIIKSIVRSVFIGEHNRLGQYVFLRNAVQSFFGRIVGSDCDHAALALDNADNALLARIAGRWASTLRTALALGSEIAFIHLNRRALQLHVGFGQQLTNLAKDAPCGFVSHSGFALNLLRGNAATSRTHLVHRIKPDVQRSGGLLKDCARKRVEVMARFARIGCAARNAIQFPILLAVRAVRHAAGIALMHDGIKANIIIGEFGLELV